MSRWAATTRERLVPFGEVEVAGDDGRALLVAFGDEVVKIFIGGRSQGFETEVIDDEERHARKGRELAVVAAGGAGGVQARGELCAGGEQHVDALTDRAVTERLGEMTLAGTAGSDDEHGGTFIEVAAGGEFVDERAVELGQAFEVELLEGLGGTEGGAAQTQLELLVLAAGDFVLDEEREELGVGELAVEGLRLQASRESRMPERRSCLRCGTSSGTGFIVDLLQGCGTRERSRRIS